VLLQVKDELEREGPSPETLGDEAHVLEGSEEGLAPEWLGHG
jgi:hypothetical protein